METKPELRKKVASKLNLTEDIENSEYENYIDSVRKTDGKFTARFVIRCNKSNELEKYNSPNYKEFNKIFGNIEEFKNYAGEFLSLSEKELSAFFKKKEKE